MSDPAPPHLFSSSPVILLKSRAGLWLFFLSLFIFAFLPSCMRMGSSGSISRKDLGLISSAGPVLWPQRLGQLLLRPG